jgi:hypothetical protein
MLEVETGRTLMPDWIDGLKNHGSARLMSLEIAINLETTTAQ